MGEPHIFTIWMDVHSPETTDYTPTPDEGGRRPVQVRAYNLRDALEAAKKVPLSDWWEPEEDDPEFWTTSDVAAYLGVKVGTVSAYHSRGQMPPPDLTRGQRTHLWRPATIRAWRGR